MPFDGTELWQQAVVQGNGDGNAVALAWDEATDLLIVLDSLGDRLHRFSAGGTRQAPVALQAAPDGSTIWGDLDVRGGEAYVLDRINRAVRVVSPRPGGATWTQRTVALPARARRLAVAPDRALLTLDRDGWVRRAGPDGIPGRRLRRHPLRPGLRLGAQRPGRRCRRLPCSWATARPA